MKQEIQDATTVAYVQALLSCHAYSQGDSQMMQGAARDAGLWPLREKDREVIKRDCGEETLARFEAACSGRHA